MGPPRDPADSRPLDYSIDLLSGGADRKLARAADSPERGPQLVDTQMADPVLISHMKHVWIYADSSDWTGVSQMLTHADSSDLTGVSHMLTHAECSLLGLPWQPCSARCAARWSLHAVPLQCRRPCSSSECGSRLLACTAHTHTQEAIWS